MVRVRMAGLALLGVLMVLASPPAEAADTALVPSAASLGMVVSNAAVEVALDDRVPTERVERMEMRIVHWNQAGYDRFITESAIGPLPPLRTDLIAGTGVIRGRVRSLVVDEVYASTNPGQPVRSSERLGWITFDLTWTRDGDAEVRPPRTDVICKLCVQWPLYGTEDARVDGKIRFGGLGRTAQVNGERGRLIWAAA